MIGHRPRVVSSAVIFMTLSCMLLSPQTSRAQELEAISKPSADIGLSFVRPGKIAKLKIKEGERVKKGQEIAVLESEVQIVQHQILAAKANNTTRQKIATAEMLQKNRDLAKLTEANKEGAVTDSEVEHAKSEAEIANLLLEVSQFEHEQDLLKEKELGKTLKEFRLYSPDNGIIEEVYMEAGESVQGLSPVLRLVNVDPLRIDVHVPISQIEAIKSEKKVMVRFPDGTEAKGTVEHVSSVANAATNTLRVRINVPNAKNRPAGEKVLVSFP